MEDLGHGDRLNGEEYDRRLAELYHSIPPVPSRQADRELRKRELNLSIDFRLGKNFPENRREALWVVAQQVEKRRVWLALRYGFRLLFFPDRIPKGLPKKADFLVGFMIQEFSRVLNKQELLRFFEIQSGEVITLPFDPTKLADK